MPKPDDHFSYIQWKDLKNVQDQTVYSFGLIVQKMRSEATRLINAVGTQATSKPLRQSNFVTLMILFRLRECMASIELLISKGLVRDASVLIQELIELRLDMQYIKRNPVLASEWIEQIKQSRRTWSVDFLLQALYPDPQEQETERNNYHHFSKIKYSDPMGHQTRFPIKDDDTVPSNGDDLTVCLFCEGSECYRILKAALTDLVDSGFTVGENESAIDELNELHEKLYSLRKSKPRIRARKYYPNA